MSPHRAALMSRRRPTPPPVVSGSILFDGRANTMTDLHFNEVTQSAWNALPAANKVGPITWTDGTVHYYFRSQVPSIWWNVAHTSQGINFIKDNMSLQADARYGKIFKCTALIGDSNAWQMKAFLAQQKAGAQVDVGNHIVLGRVDYYAFATRVDAWPLQSNTQWADFVSFGYQTAANDQLALALKYDSTNGFHYSIQSNAGFGNNSNTNPTGTTFYRDKVKAVTLGRWEEWIIAVKWATDKSGFVSIYNRIPSISSIWSGTPIYTNTGIDTQFYGTSPYGNFAQTGARDTVDKIGIYYGVFPAGTQQTFFMNGFTRCDTLAKAESTLPA